LLQELHDNAKVRDEAYKLRGTGRYNMKTKLRSFQEWDLVWRMRGEARKELTYGKFASNWESLFQRKKNL